MRRVLLLLICAVCFSPLLRAQKLKDDISCYSDRKDNAPHKKKLWEGYEISLGPSRDPEAVEEKCTAAIYNSTGRVVFRTSGFNVVFDEEQTGKDFDGDGKPDILWRNGTTGENLVWFMSGSTISSSTPVNAVPGSWSIVR